jgi:hypothetical protein
VALKVLTKRNRSRAERRRQISRTNSFSNSPTGENKMAIDVYLQIDGIKGESQDDKHTRTGSR